MYVCMYVRAATMETAVNGFRKTGIIPYNPNIFSDVDFVAQIQSHYVNGTPATQMDSNPPTSPSSASTVSPQQIRAVPVIQASTSARRGSAILVTSSPHKTKIEEAFAKKNAPARKRVSSSLPMTPATQTDSNPSTSSTSAITVSPQQIKARKKLESSLQKKIKTAPKKKTETSSDSECSDGIHYVSTDNEDSDNDDAQCPVCGKYYSSNKSGEKWICCTKCFQWHHENFNQTKDLIKFICDICLDG